MPNHYEEVYYYKTPHGDNIPVSTGEGNILRAAMFPSEECLNKIFEQHPEARGNLYVWVNGKDFKIN